MSKASQALQTLDADDYEEARRHYELGAIETTRLRQEVAAAFSAHTRAVYELFCRGE